MSLFQRGKGSHWRLAADMEVKMPAFFCSLFCKLAQTLRMKITAFGHDVNISVRCLRMLVQAVDFRSVDVNFTLTVGK